MAAATASKYAVYCGKAFGTAAQNWSFIGGINQAPGDGEQIFVLVAITGTITAAPAGYTLDASGSAGTINWYLYSKVAASEPTALTFNTAPSGSDNVALLGVSFADQTQSVEGTAGTGTGGSPAVAPGVTLPAGTGLGGAAALLVAGFAAGTTWTPPGGWSTAGTSAGGTGSVAGTVAFQNGFANGAVLGSVSSTSSGTGAWVAVQVGADDAVTVVPRWTVGSIAVGQ